MFQRKTINGPRTHLVVRVLGNFQSRSNDEGLDDHNDDPESNSLCSWKTTMVVEESSTGVNENASELQFDPEFEDIHILSNAQVAIILQASARSAVNRDEELNDVYRKTQKYVERFNTMTNPEKDHQELVDELDNLQE